MKTLLSLLLACALSLPVLVEAKTMYVRPLAACANNGDGTAYACAAGAGAVGAYSNLGGVAFGSGANQVSNGDTLYICGFHAGGNDGVRADNNLTPTTSITIDGACPADPGSILSANHVLTSGWTGPDAFGAYSIASGGSSSPHMAQLVSGVPVYLPNKKTAVPDASWDYGSFYDTDAGTKYVKPLGGVSANATTIYTTWGDVLTITNVTVTIQNLTIYGLSLDRCIKLTNADNSLITANTIKWCAFAAISLESASDDVTITNNTITQSGNGIYLIASNNTQNNHRATITGNTITDLDQYRRYADFTSDNIAIGIQGGTGHVVSRNNIRHLAGDCLGTYSAAGQTMSDTTFSYNLCFDIRDKSGLSPLTTMGFDNGSTNSGQVANDSVNNVVSHNTFLSVGGSCVWAKASTPSVGTKWRFEYNLLYECDTALSMEDTADGDIGFTFAHNTLAHNTVQINHFNNGSDSLAGIAIDQNIYCGDGAVAYEWNGTKSAYAAWKTNSSQDASSMVKCGGLPVALPRTAASRSLASARTQAIARAAR